MSKQRLPIARPGFDYKAYRALRVFPSLDGLRCFCIVPVIFFHSSDTLFLGRLGARGFLGVDMFFVLSGFLIVTLLLRERERRGEFSLGNFYVRRALRIWPLYYGIALLLAFAFLTVARNGSQAEKFFEEAPYYATFTSNWFRLTTMMTLVWSLAAEEKFYLVWPAIERFARHAVPILIALLVLSELIRFRVFDGALADVFLKSSGAHHMLHVVTFTPILLGVLLAHLLHDRKTFGLIARFLSGRYASLILMTTLLACIALIPGDLVGAPWLTLHILMTLLLASIVVRPDHALSCVLEERHISRIGAISYGMYLWHMFALHVAYTILRPTQLTEYLLFPLTLGLTIVMADVSYRYYETPFLRLKALLAARSDRMRTT